MQPNEVDLANHAIIKGTLSVRHYPNAKHLGCKKSAAK